MTYLSRIPGYSLEQRQRFNFIYEALLFHQIELREDSEAVKPIFSDKELEEFRSFYKLAKADEEKRLSAMDGRTLESYSVEEIEWFDQMQKVLSQYNASIQKRRPLPELPDFSDIEMIEHSQYRELWLAKECK